MSSLSYPKTALSLLSLGDEIRDGLHRLGLLFLRRDSGGQVPLLRSVVTELGVIAALNFHHVLCVVDLVLHTLVQRAIDGEGVGGRIVAVEVGSQQNKAVYLVRVLGSELGGHGPAHGVTGDVPVPNVRKLGHHIFRCVHVENSQVEGHLHQNAGEAGLPELVQQGQIGGGLHLGPGVEDDRGVRGIGWGEDGQIIPNLQMISACLLYTSGAADEL